MRFEGRHLARIKFTPAIGTKICLLLAGGESLRSICKRADMPVRSVVHEWVLDDPEFAAKYEMAQSLRADELFDECLEIADDSSRDTVTKTRPDGSTYEGFDFDHIARSRLRVDTRKWVCGRMLPKKYGDKVVNEVVGKDGGPIAIGNLNADDLRASIAADLAKVGRQDIAAALLGGTGPARRETN